MPSRKSHSSHYLVAVVATLSLACTADLGASGKGGGDSAQVPRDPNDPVGEGGTASDPNDPSAPVDCDSPPAEVGAPVPLRRLTSSQLSATVADVLLHPAEYDLTDETLFGFKSNTTTSVDITTARSIEGLAEDIAEAVIPGLAGDPRCETQCGGFLLDEIASRLFRRPLDAETRARFLSLYEQGVAQDGVEEGLMWALTGILQSPRFVYQLETADPDGRLDAHSLAARLSYALLGGPPDEALLASAIDGDLDSDEGIEAAANRLIDDPRLVRGMEAFANYWLKLEKMSNVAERPDIAALDPEHREALMREPVEFIARLMQEGASTSELFSSTTIPALPALADVYGSDVVDVTGETATLDGSRRAGVFSLAGTMAALAHAGQTAPTLRGLTVLDHVLCDPPPPPPPGIATVLPEGAPDATLRERLEGHLEEPACAGCHQAMDGIGFAFEGVDWLGRARTTDNGSPVDTTADFVIAGDDVSVAGPVDIATVLAGRPEPSACFARQFTRFAVGIPEGREVECAIEDFGGAAQSEGLRSMAVAVVTSPWFVQAGVIEETE